MSRAQRRPRPPARADCALTPWRVAARRWWHSRRNGPAWVARARRSRADAPARRAKIRREATRPPETGDPSSRGILRERKRIDVEHPAHGPRADTVQLVTPA